MKTTKINKAAFFDMVNNKNKFDKFIISIYREQADKSGLNTVNFLQLVTSDFYCECRKGIYKTCLLLFACG
ncbi:MAG: hypothetical protein UZ20_WS6002000627 [candidate division WS6 bacterium OLB21]|uniref:Uncharacterized protein n=1 Tax=candidate division WS6 bacterium OLB21 TaxID=1617427 RepID=A0A136KJ30_9BACT|nr:MAG: hypothetical protein UZ20_WS6002000627 [candidate division WS6 bacterium OLB21]